MVNAIGSIQQLEIFQCVCNCQNLVKHANVNQSQDTWNMFFHQFTTCFIVGISSAALSERPHLCGSSLSMGRPSSSGVQQELSEQDLVTSSMLLTGSSAWSVHNLAEHEVKEASDSFCPTSSLVQVDLCPKLLQGALNLFLALRMFL